MKTWNRTRCDFFASVVMRAKNPSIPQKTAYERRICANNRHWEPCTVKASHSVHKCNISGKMVHTYALGLCLTAFVNKFQQKFVALVHLGHWLSPNWASWNGSTNIFFRLGSIRKVFEYRNYYSIFEYRISVSVFEYCYSKLFFRIPSLAPRWAHFGPKSAQFGSKMTQKTRFSRKKYLLQKSAGKGKKTLFWP